MSFFDKINDVAIVHTFR